MSLPGHVPMPNFSNSLLALSRELKHKKKDPHFPEETPGTPPGSQD